MEIICKITNYPAENFINDFRIAALLLIFANLSNMSVIMDKFTSGERRGTIAVVGVIAVIVLYLAVSRSMHQRVPDINVDTIVTELSVRTSTMHAADTSDRARKKKHKKNSRSASRRRAIRKSADVIPDRDPLSEPADRR